MRLTEVATPIFARHETFHPRYGWFRKAYFYTHSDSQVFSAEEAPVTMGVGKNMVKSIRFWGQAAKIITRHPEPSNPRSPGMVPTRMGEGLFGEQGWDQYMEDPGTIWLLHWLLLAQPTLLPVWWLSFNELHAVEFDEDTLDTAIATQLEATTWKTPNQSSVKKDVTALLRTYAPAVRAKRTAIDDLLDCPLRELGLIRRSSATGKYRFVTGLKPSLPSSVITFAALDYVARRGLSGQSVTLAHLANEAGGPGRAFKLSVSDLHEALLPLASNSSDLTLLSPTGAQQLAWKRDPAVIAVEVLNDYYDKVSSLVAAGLEGDKPYEDPSSVAARELIRSTGLMNPKVAV